MAQKRLASTLLTAGSTSAVYTVPAGKSATVSVFARNVGDTTGSVSLAHSQLASPPADNSVAKQLNTTNYTTTKYAPLGTLNLGTTNINLAVPNNITTGSDPSPSSGYGPIGIWDETTNTVTQPYNSGWGSGQWTMSSSGYYTGRYQISGFYGENDYYVMNSSRYPRRVKGYPWDKVDKNMEGYSDSFGGYDSAPSYYDYGSVGFRQQMYYIQSNGYLTRHYNINSSSSSSGNNTNYTSSGNSPYNLSANYNNPIPYSLSILPTSRLSTANLRLVTGTTWTTGSNAIWSAQITDSTSSQAYTDFQMPSRSSWGGTYSTTELSWQWYRPVGDYVYAASPNRVYRAPITSWWTSLNNWTDVTSNFPSNLHFYFPFIEDKNGYGYTITTNGDVLVSTDGINWLKADSSTITSGIGSLTNSYTGPKVNSYDQFNVYTSTGKYLTLSSLGSPSIKGDLFEFNLSLPSKSHLEHKGIILNAGDKVYARTTSADMIIDIYGFEE